MNCSTSGFPVHHQLLEVAQIHVHRVGDAIQQFHPLSFPFPPLCFVFLPSFASISSVQSLSCVLLFLTACTAAHQASLSITNSWSLLKLMSIESVMPSNHLILCCPLLLLPSIFSSIRVFTNESVLCIRWPKYWSFSFSISPSKWIFRTDFH